MASVPKVATIAGIRRPAASIALPAPIIVPTAIPMTNTNAREEFGCSESQRAETKALDATIAPTERSICLPTIRSACPRATIQTSVPDRATCSRFEACRNRGSRNVIARQIASRATSNFASRVAQADSRVAFTPSLPGYRAPAPRSFFVHLDICNASRGVGGRQQQLGAVEPSACLAGRDLAAAKHNNSIGHPNQFFRVVTNQDRRHAGRRQLRDRTVNLRLGAHINPTRGLI